MCAVQDLSLVCTIDMVVDNLEDREDYSQFEAEGVGAPDGRLDLCELIIITNTTVIDLQFIVEFAKITQITQHFNTILCRFRVLFPQFGRVFLRSVFFDLKFHRF